MSGLEVISADAIDQPRRRLPPWLRRPLPFGDYGYTDRLIADLGLETVCEEAKCPNRTECWSHKTATFMVLGRVCTRPCGFCAVERGRPEPPAADEPERLAEAAFRLGLEHVVITSVNRDDLLDGGAEHFRRCVVAVRERTAATIEVLTPDFDGNLAAVDVLLDAAPEVFNHNLETVARLQASVRKRANYRDSLRVLEHVAARRPDVVTKSGLMLGLGETIPELMDALADLRRVGVRIVTLGQYLQPSEKLLPVERFAPPEEFAAIGRLAERMGFSHVASAPFVRSSYHAGEAWHRASIGLQANPSSDP